MVASEVIPDTRAAPPPLVTIGMPIRNGEPYFERALAGVLAQDYPNLEIIVSDNGSIDGTASILARVSAGDSRIRIVRQDETLTAFDNFAWVLGQANGKYFLWAAHDDLRPKHYVSSLVGHLERHPEAVLAFGELRVSQVFGETYHPKYFRYENAGLGPYARMRQAAHQQCYHIYGVWKTDALKAIPFIFNPWWPDLPIMVAAGSLGEFHRVPGVVFDYLEMPKTNLQRAQYQDNSVRVCRVSRAVKLFWVTYQTVSRVRGAVAGVLAMMFVIEKQFRVVWGLMTGQIKRGQL